MKDNLISIGKMAEINHTTIATLRLYDEKGLLKPKYIDPETNYRYYDIRQNARLDIIAYMKELNMSLNEIVDVLESGNIDLIESLLTKKEEQIHQQINDLKLKHEAINRTISAIDYYRKSPIPGVPSLQFIDVRYIWKHKCSANFYDGTIDDYEKEVSELRNRLLENDFDHVHTYNVATSIKKEDFEKEKLIADDVLIFVERHLYKNRKDISMLDSGMYACIYANSYDEEIECAHKLFLYCQTNNYIIDGDYICEVLTEFNVFDESKRAMFLRIQVPVKFKK